MVFNIGNNNNSKIRMRNQNWQPANTADSRCSPLRCFQALVLPLFLFQAWRQYPEYFVEERITTQTRITTETTITEPPRPPPPPPATATTTEPKKTRTFAPECPTAIVQNRGVFRTKPANDNDNNFDWDGVVLLTSTNTGYKDMLQNWEYLANQLGLKWAVAALDERTFEELGSNRSFSTDKQYSFERESKFRKSGFSLLTCNKFRMVLSVLNHCELDIVFSDPDNVFLKDPFQHEMGNFIKSGTHDYVYQVNYLSDEAYTPMTFADRGEYENETKIWDVSEGNTGFHYLSHKNELLKEVIQETLDVCAMPDNKFDDQRLFWNTLRAKFPFRLCDKTQQQTQTSGGAFPWTHYNIDKSSHAPLSVCYLDPYYYRVGAKKFPPNDKMKQDMVVYHANFVAGKKKKIRSLQNNTYNGYGWDVSRLGDTYTTWY